MSNHKPNFRKAKQLLAGFLVLILLVTGVPLELFAVKASEVLYGDVNSDGLINQSDVSDLTDHLAEYDIDIDEQASDVNLDGTVDLIDLLLLKKYVAGLDVILGESCVITFDTQGGSSVEPITVKKGTKLSQIPTTSKNGSTFLGWETTEGDTFYSEDLITDDLSLVAKFEELPPKEVLSLISFALTEQQPTLSFVILAAPDTPADLVRTLISLTSMDGSDPVELDILYEGSDRFRVRAKTGFTPGASYELELAEGLTFENKADTIRTASFTIYKEEVSNITLNDDMVYIKDTDSMDYFLDGSSFPVPVLEAALLNSQANEAITGTFIYNNINFSVGDVLCIYENTDPRERDLLNEDYSDDKVAYIKVTEISGSTVTFTSLDESSVEDVIFMPDTIPFSVEALPSGECGTIPAAAYDNKAWISFGYTEPPEFDEGDFIVLYQGDFFDMTDESLVCFGRITSVSEDTLTYTRTTAEEIENSIDLFLKDSVDGDSLLENVDTQALSENIERQVMRSGFAVDAANYLAATATQLRGIGGELELGDDIKVKVEIGKSSKYFKDGIRLAVGIEGEFGVDIGEDAEMKIDLAATFVEEISVDVDVDAKAKWKWYFIIPVLKDLSFRTSVDLKNYAGVSVDVKVYTVEKDEGTLWSKLKEYKEEYGEIFDQIEEIEEKINEAKETYEKLQGYKEDLENLWATIPAAVAGDYEETLEALEGTNISDDLLGLLNMTSETELDAGVRDLMERYSEMLENESEWVELLNKEIFHTDIVIFIVAIGIDVNFIIKANINIALGANLEYVIGKRYSFWINVFSKTSGSSEMDLLDEKFAFQFYVMGALGLKMGIEAGVAVGLFSTKLGSIGLTVEFGPYIKLWGYFIYEYSKMRPANTNTWIYDERMMGALYLEFGIYLEMTFKAQLFNNAIKYEPTLLDKEWPLLTVGERNNVYDFAYEIEDDEVLIVKDTDNNSTTGISMILPDTYRLMSRIDLCEGDMEEYIYGTRKYHYALSNRYFSIDPATSIISVDVPDGIRYMECDLTLTWKTDKLAFSKHDLTVTIPLVWTNLSTSELNEKFTVSVKAGNPSEGYRTIWSSRITKNKSFDLPSQDDILGLLKYSSYDIPGSGNLRYSSYTGYGTQKIKELAVMEDTTYYFDLTTRTYDMPVMNVQKQDGTLQSITVSAKYGDKFDLSSVRVSGTNDSETQTYTSFYRINTKDTSGNEISSDTGRIIDTVFARELISGTSFTAEYTDNSATITYVFTGIDLPVKTTVIRKGTVPPDIFTTEVTAMNAVVTGISPVLGPVMSSTEYSVVCKLLEKPAVIRKVTFITGDPSQTTAADYPEGAVIIAPSAPERYGYEFTGWFSSDAPSDPYVFSTMPEHDLELVAGWKAKTSQITFDPNEGSMPEGTSDVLTVNFDSSYGLLPLPVRTGFAFIGWYTDRVSGINVLASDKVDSIDDQTLYAHWEEKDPIDPLWITFPANQIYKYNYEPRSVIFSTGTSGLASESFVVQYKRQNLDSEWMDIAENAGTYDVKITRPEDGVYRSFEKTYTSVMQINKISRTIPAPSNSFIFKSSVEAYRIPSDSYKGNGTVEYALHIYKTGAPSSGWQTSPVFMNVKPGTYYLYSRISEGENHLAAVSFASTAVEVTHALSPSFFNQFWIGVKTSDIGSAGTDSIIEGSLSFYDYNYCSVYELSGSENDHERGDYRRYFFSPHFYFNTALKPDPWMINHVRIDYEKKGTAAGWHCEYVKVGVANNNGSYFGESLSGIPVGQWFGAEDHDSKYVSWISPAGATDAMKRNITSVGNFYSGLPSSVVLGTNETGSFDFTYNGLVTDQYSAFAGLANYNVYDHFDAPTLSVSANKPGYDTLIPYHINSFSFNKSALRQAMAANGDRQIELDVTLQFPVRSTVASTSTYTKKMVISLDEQLPLNSMAVSMSYPSRTFMPLYAIEKRQKSGDTVDFTITVPENTGMWGLKARISYDHDLLTLTGSRLGNVFIGSEVTTTEDLDSEKFIFLASRDDFNNTVMTGNLITLTFLVKADYELTEHPVTYEIVQAIDSESDLKTFLHDGSGPTISVSGNTAEILVSDKVTIDARGGSENILKLEVSKDSGDFTDITESYDSGHLISVNGSYTFRVTDTSGTTASTTLIYTNLDSAGPVLNIDTGSYSEGTWTNGDVIFRLTNETDNLGLTTFMYKLGNGDWQEYITELIVPSDGGVKAYSFKAISESGIESDISSFIISHDSVAPVGEISVASNIWNTLLNDITFGLFFQETLTVEIEAEDEDSGIAKIEYHLANSVVGDPEGIEDWTEYTDTFDITPNNSYVIYVRFTDIAGNSSIISSNGITLNADEPEPDDDNPQTSDTGFPYLWLILMLCAVSAVFPFISIKSLLKNNKE